MARIADDAQLRSAVEKAYAPYLSGEESPNRDNAKKTLAHRWFGFVPLELYCQTQNPDYLERGVELAEEQYADVLETGLPAYTARWYVDDIYGACTMQSLAYRCTKDKKHLDRAVTHVLTYSAKLQRPNGLFHHLPENPVHWGRGNGWCASAFAELLTVMPESHPEFDEVARAYRRMMDALIRFQDDRGMWRQIVDNPQSWPETSCTGMFLFALASGVNNGWLPRDPYRSAIEKGWEALAGYVDEQGRLKEVCIGTGHGDGSVNHYMTRPRKTGDAHGQAALLWAVSAVAETIDSK
jgi:rhamnogalacturonyl hydrolase YesR